MTTDEILQQIGLKYEELTSVERETFSTWLEALNKSQLTIERIRTYIASMRDAVITELTQVPMGNDRDYLLKARLRNYMLLEAFLSTPEKAKKALENALAGIRGKR
jgi:hypothetical protein